MGWFDRDHGFDRENFVAFCVLAAFIGAFALMGHVVSQCAPITRAEAAKAESCRKACSPGLVHKASNTCECK